MISVVIPLYNKENSIRRTLLAVLQQTYRDFEIVIVNDGSTDNSVVEAQKVKDERIRIIHQKNAGVSAARNRGIAEARGEFIAFLDADDEWKEDYLAAQIGLAEKYPQCDVFACNYEFRDTKGRVTQTILRKLPFADPDGILSNYFEVASCSHPPLWTSAVMVSKNALQSVGGFPVGIKSGEDLLTWARLACRYQIAFHRTAKATFCVEGYQHSEKPKRIPAVTDDVGKELNELLKKYSSKGLRNYNCLWHKMRSSIYLRLGMRRNSIREAYIGLKYNWKNYKLYIYILLNLLPKSLRKF